MQVKKNWMGLGMKGMMDFRPNGEWDEDPFPVPGNMPLKDHDRPDKFQNWLSSYTINSFLESITEAANLHLNAPSTLTGMTCGKVSALLPGISEAYGADTPVDIKININKIGDFAVTEKNSQMSAVSDLHLKFYIPSKGNEYAAGLKLEGTKLGMTALTQDMTLTINI